MRLRIIRSGIVFHFTIVKLVLLSLMTASNARADYAVISDEFVAGTKGNSVVFSVRNNTNQELTGVRMKPQFPLQFSEITSIDPGEATLAPGESTDFTIEFSVYKGVPPGLQDTITLFFENNEQVKIDNPQFQIIINIIGAEQKRKPNTAYFKVLVKGSGYTATYGDGTYEVSGSEEMYLLVHRGQSAAELLAEMKKNLDGDPCERTWPGQGGAEVGAPRLFTSGSQVTIIDGPYYDYNEFFGNLKLEKNWQINSKDGPSPKEMAERVCR